MAAPGAVEIISKMAIIKNVKMLVVLAGNTAPFPYYCLCLHRPSTQHNCVLRAGNIDNIPTRATAVDGHASIQVDLLKFPGLLQVVSHVQGLQFQLSDLTVLALPQNLFFHFPWAGVTIERNESKQGVGDRP